MKILLILTLCLISDGGASNKVTGYSGGEVFIKCKYLTAYTPNRKYLCKGPLTDCSDQIKTHVKNQWVSFGRFSLFDDTVSEEFWVMIRNLGVWDAGTYHCGVDLTLKSDVYTPVEVTVKEGPSVSREVHAYAGGEINIKCRYESKDKNKPKSFCKIEAHQRRCFKQTLTNLKSKGSHDHRFSVHENKHAGFFSVIIRELVMDDSGTYACGVVVFEKIEIYTALELKVREDQFYKKSISETVHVGGDSTLSCKYPESLRSFPKFLCWRLPGGACSYKHSVNESRKSVNVGKFILNDERAKGMFTVSVRNVSEQNHGEFWCGAEVNWESDNGYKVYFTHISLRVTDPRGSVSTSRPTQPSSSSSSSPSSPSSPSSSPSSPPLLLINKLQLTPAPPPAGFPVSAVITVSVILLLLLIGSIFIVVTMQASSGRSSGQGPGNHPGVPLDVCVYEEIKDTRRSSASDTGTCTIYSSAQLPTILSDQCIYSRAQRPARLSAESLNYATVGSHSAAAGENAVVPRALCNRTDVSCEYGTVSHVS